MNVDPTPAAIFVAIILGVIAVAYVGALSVFAVWFVRALIAEVRSRKQRRNIPAGGYVPRGTVSDSNGNVRVIREVKP